MGLFDKLKNVFFEEEEVEVVEKEEPREKAPVAKKIDVEVKKKEEINKEEKLDINLTNTMEFEKEDEEKNEKDFKFPIGFDDKDFEVEKTMEIFAKTKEIDVPKIVNEIDEVSDEPPLEKHEEEKVQYEPIQYEPIQYEEKKVVKELPKEEHRLYVGKEETSKTTFTPSPIISPIYGILNKNYKKEEIVSRRDKKVPITENKKDELDVIREKAYGDLAKDISSSIEDEIIENISLENEEEKEKEKGKEKGKEKEDLLYDLSEESSPAVKVVTVGDAEEYFNDLGLEYNVDYKVEKEPDKKEEVKQDKEEKKTRVEKHKEEDNLEDDKNLFDLIDAMYDDEEKD